MSAASVATRILVAEDDKDDFFLLRRLLKDRSDCAFDLTWVQTFTEASALAREEKHDVYLIDMKLVGGSGTDLLREMKERGSDKPVILLTGAQDSDIDAHAIELGAADYLVKGDFNAATLIRSIRYAVERKQVEAALRKSTERLALIVTAQQDIAAAGVDLGQLMKVMCERAQALLRGTGAVVEFVEGDELVYKAVSGSTASQLGMRIKAATSLSGMCVRSGQIMKCDDADADDRVDKAACAKANIKSMIVVPLKNPLGTSGVLKVVSDQKSAFTDEDVRTLQLLSGLASTAFNQAEEFEIRSNLIDQLRDAMSNVKTLSGLLPICANCKKVRDDKGYWNQIELFIRDHSSANFSHGICPECSQKLYPTLYQQTQERIRQKKS